VPLEEFSPSFLGVYRKVMVIEDEIVRYAAKYGVDVALARAVCMYESGGNADLQSSAGANGYFQVMPSTFRLMRVKTNVEAGIKYLGQLVKQFGREDYALAAYNGGPGRVAARRPMPLESLQYVIGVGIYRSVLKLHEPSVRVHAARLGLTEVQSGEDWWELGRRLNLTVTQLRLHNPFLAARPLRAGYRVAYPREPRNDVFADGGPSRYRTLLGDNYFKVAFTLGVDLDLLRDANQLWRLQPLWPGTELVIPSDPSVTFTRHTAAAGDDLARLAARLKVDPWDLVRDNHLWTEEVREGMVLQVRRARPAPAPERAPEPAFRVHRVRAGETLIELARRYQTTVRAIQAANALGRRTLVKVGQQLRIPQ
jgi:LysM repeat protein